MEGEDAGLDALIEEPVIDDGRFPFQVRHVPGDGPVALDLPGALGGMAGEVLRLLADDGVDVDDEAAVVAWMARFEADVAAGRRPGVAESWRAAGTASPPILDERAPAPDPTKLAVVAVLLDELDVPGPHRRRAEAVGAELVRVCDAVLDGRYLIDAIAALVALTLVTGSGIDDGTAAEWAGGILWAVGADLGLGDPVGVPYVPADQFARIVGVPAPTLTRRAAQLRAVLTALTTE